MANDDDGERVGRNEFVALMALLGQADRDQYRALRERGWLEVERAGRAGQISGKSEIPN